MIGSFASATKQMLDRISTLERDVDQARKEGAEHPSVFGVYDVPTAPPAVIQSVNIFVAKEKERDTFVTAATRLHEFVERICSYDSIDRIDMTSLVQDARSILKVCTLDALVSPFTLASKPATALRCNGCPRGGRHARHGRA
jgi:hypothetical protein